MGENVFNKDLLLVLTPLARSTTMCLTLLATWQVQHTQEVNYKHLSFYDGYNVLKVIVG